MPRHTGRLRLLGAAVLTCAVSAPFALATPALAATSVASFEAETMGLSSSLGRITADAGASAGKTLAIWSNGAAVKSVTTAQAADRLLVRVRGTQCSGAPKLQVKVDGAQVLAAPAASTYGDLAAAVGIPAGAHKISAGLINDYRTSACDRNLSIDKVTLTRAATPAPAPAPAPATAPSISNLASSVEDGVATISFARSGGAIGSLTWRTIGSGVHTGSVAEPDVSSFSTPLPSGTYTMYVRAANTLGADEDPVTITIPAAPAPAPAPAPTPEPTPEPDPVPSGRLIWNGDFSTGSLSQYTATGGKVQYDTSVDEMRVVDDPVLGSPAAGGRKALKVTVHDSSRDPAQDSPKHRAQAESPKVIGLTDEVYVGYSILLPDDFPTVHTAGPVTWGGADVQQASMWEVHGAPYGGSPPMGFRIRDSLAQQRFGFFQGHPFNVMRSSQLFSAISPRGRWVDVVAHIKMGASSSTGFYEQSMNWGEGWRPTVFDNGSTRLNMATAIPSVNGGGKNYSKVSLYYNDNAWPVATVYFAAHRIGTTFDVVSPRTYG